MPTLGLHPRRQRVSRHILPRANASTKPRGGSRGGGGGGGGFRGLQPPPPPPKLWRPTVNSAQEFKFIVQYASRVQYNLSAKRKQAYPVRGAVEPRLLNRSEDWTGSRVFT